MFLFIIAAASVPAQPVQELGWDPAQDNSYTGGSGVWNTTSSFWWNGTANVPWIQGTNAYLGGAGGTITVASTSGIIVSNLIAAQGIGNYVIGSTAAGQGITVLNGAVWNVGGGNVNAHLFFSQTCVMNMAPGSTLTMTGPGLTQFGAARTAEWNVGGSTLNITSGTIEGSAMDIGDFNSIWITNGAVFESIRNASQTYTNNFVLTGGTATILSGIANSHNLALTGVISGPGGVIFPKSGTDFYNLSNTNTYSGSTEVGGVVDMTTSGKTGGGGILLDDGSIWSVTQTSSNSTLFTCGLTNASGGFMTNNLILNNGNPVQPVIVATNLSPGSAVCTLNVSGTGLVAGQFPLIKYQTQDGTLTSSSYVLGTTVPGLLNTLSNNIANNSIDLVLSVAPIYWTAASNNNWDNATINWEFSDLTPTAYNGGYLTIFDDTASSHIVDVVSNIAANNEIVVSNATPYVFQNGGGTIGGSGNFLKLGSGSITMGSSNNYAGNTVISSGLYVAGSTNAIPYGTGKGNVEVEGTLDMDGLNIGVNGLTGAGVVTNSAGSGTNVFVYDGGTSVFNGVFAENPAGAGISLYCYLANLTLASPQSYRGGSYVAYGSLVAGTANALPTNGLLYVGVSPINFPAGFFLNGFDVTIGGLISSVPPTTAFDRVANDSKTNSNCSLTVNVAAGQTYEWFSTLGDLSTTATYTTNANNFNLIKDGSGTQLIDLDVALYTGATTVKGGTLVFYAVTNALWAVTNTITVQSGGILTGNALNIGGPVVVQSGGTLAAGLDAVGTNGIFELSISNSLVLAPGSITVLALDNDAAANDVIAGQGVTYGGTLVVSNTGTTTLASGETFQLFQNSGVYAGNFSGITVLPATGLFGSFNPTNGLLTITSTPSIPTTPTNILISVSGGQLSLSWPSSYLGWSLQVQTNSLGAGLSTNWFTIPGSSLVTATNFPIVQGNATVFYRMIYQP